MSKQEQQIEKQPTMEQQMEEQEQPQPPASKGRRTKKRKSIRLFTNLQLIILSTAIFAAYMIFFDSNNIYVKSELQSKIAQLQRTRDSLAEQITADSIIIEGIERDDKFLERYAREHFYMRREGEETFIVKQPKADTAKNRLK